MKAELTISQLYNNPSVLNFFFRTQSENTFNELIDSVIESRGDVFDAIENHSDDLDEIEGLFYDEPLHELADIFGLTLAEDDEAEDEVDEDEVDEDEE